MISFIRYAVSAYLFLLFAILAMGGIPYAGKQYFVFVQDLARVGIVLVLLWLFAFKRSWNEIPFLRVGREVFASLFLRAPIQKKQAAHLFIFAGLAWMAVCFFLAPILRHWFFETRAFDVGIYENVIFNGANSGALITNTFELIRGEALKFFPNNHLDWSLWFYAWIYKLIPHTEVLLFSQSLGFFLCLFPFSELAKRHLKNKNQVLLAILCFLCFDSIRRNNLWEYHSVSWVFFFSLSALNAFDRRDTKKGFIFGFLSTLFRVDAWWVFSGIILFWGIHERKNRSRLALGIFLAVVAFCVLPIHSAIYNQVNLFDQRYGYLGHSMSEAARFALQNPGVVFQTVFNSEHLNFLFELFLRTGGFPNLLSASALVAGIFPFAQIFFSDSHSFLNWTLHYVVLFFGPLFYTLVLGWKRLSEKFFTVSIALMVSQLALLETSEVQRVFRDYSQKSCEREIVKLIPPDAKLLARDPYFAQLSRRRWISVPAHEGKQDVAEWFITPIREDLSEFGLLESVNSWEIVSEKCGVFLAKRPQIR